MKKIVFVISLLLLLQNVITTRSFAFGYCSEPTEPSCVSTLGISDDTLSLELCKSEIESFTSDLNRYIDCRNDEIRDLKRKAEEAIEKYNCHARRESYCP